MSMLLQCTSLTSHANVSRFRYIISLVQSLSTLGFKYYLKTVLVFETLFKYYTKITYFNTS